MITDKEISEYRLLCAALEELHEKYLGKKRELRILLEKTGDLRREALEVLVKANRLTRHLTGHQRQITGLGYHLGEIKARLNQNFPVLFQGAGMELRPVTREEQAPAAGSGGAKEGEALPDLYSWQSCDFQSQDDYRSGRELRQRGLLILGMIDNIRKKLLQLDVLELRCRELMLSINKALEAFHHESRIIRRKIYPFGIFSLLNRNLRRLLGGSYFSHHDMKDIAALGNITGCILKIADSPVI